MINTILFENLYKWLSVMLLSMLKFVGGPLAGFALRLSLFENIFLTILGMMLSVLIVSTSGTWFRTTVISRFQKKKKLIFTKRNRKVVTIWNKYGIIGVAALTPILFTPIGGTALVVSFGEPIYKIWLYMLASAIFWSILINVSLYFFGTVIGLK
ncbi:MAG: hypothetical protein ACKVOU_06675 [Cytophagales bacterium]